MSVPRVLHQIWIGTRPIPAEFAAWRERWLALHPDWEHRLWTEPPVPLRNQSLYDAAPDIVPDNIGQFRADIARYEILYEHGGVYVDMDMEPLQPLDGLLAEGHGCFVGWEVERVWANNAVVAASPRHPWLADLIDGLADHVARNLGRRPNVLSGPRYITPRLTSEVHVYPRTTFYPYGFDQIGTQASKPPYPKESYAAHHWWNTRTNKPAVPTRRRARPQVTRRGTR